MNRSERISFFEELLGMFQAQCSAKIPRSYEPSWWRLVGGLKRHFEWRFEPARPLDFSQNAVRLGVEFHIETGGQPRISSEIRSIASACKAALERRIGQPVVVDPSWQFSKGPGRFGRIYVQRHLASTRRAELLDWALRSMLLFGEVLAPYSGVTMDRIPSQVTEPPSDSDGRPEGDGKEKPAGRRGIGELIAEQEGRTKASRQSSVPGGEEGITRKVGRGGSVTIPAPLRERLGLREGAEVVLSVKDGGLLLRLKPKEELSLADRLMLARAKRTS